ncbi:hypothetical protein LJB86_05545 [Deltaproteobacteria bacterium OttesenSCG-928-M10]|nr:hypothetical protein [Deltaproteobacteria bacterium OttesenSCG-928-M10]
MRKAFLICLVMVALAASPLWAAPAKTEPVLKTPFTELVAFGDSFSDDGFADGHGFKRYTNTLTWVEYLARMLDLPLYNLAWGGAMSDDRNYANGPDERWSGLLWQVDEYLKELPKGADISKILFTIKCGSNDAWSDIPGGEVSAKNVREAMTRLAKAGAKYILYRETSAVLMAPGYLEGKYADYHDPWRKLVDDMNVATKKELAEFGKEFPNVKVIYQDTDTLFTKIKNGEEGYKFEILDKQWWGTYTYPHIDKYMWYDEWHPMGQVHKLMADETVEALKASGIK